MQANWVKETTPTTGAGPISLGGAFSAEWTACSEQFVDGDEVDFFIKDGLDREFSTGIYNTAGNTLTRATVHETMIAGVHDKATPTAINLSGSAIVFCAPSSKFPKFFGNTGADNGGDDAGILVHQTTTVSDRYCIGVSATNVHAPESLAGALANITVTFDGWAISALNSTASHSSQTYAANIGMAINQSILADPGKTVIITDSQGVKINTPTKIGGGGTETVINHYGINILNQSGYADTESAAMRIANNNFFKYRNLADTALRKVIGMNTSDDIEVGDVNEVLILNGLNFTVSNKQLFRTAIESGLVIQSPVFFGIGAPVDSTIYHQGFLGPEAGAGTAGPLVIPRAGRVKHISVSFVNSVIGSNEASTVSFRLNNLTDTVISSAVDNSNVVQTVTKDMDVSVAKGDTFMIKWVTPVWVTNPSTVYMNATIYME